MALRCPTCGNGLAGLESDFMFYCSDCRLACEPVEDRFAQHPIAVQKPRHESESGKLFWASFWVFDVITRVDAKPKESERAGEVAIQYPQVWVAAFRMWRPTYFGNPGFLYTSNKISPDIDDKRDPPQLIGCVLGKERAAEFVKPFVLSVIDRRVDVANIDISCEISKTQLLAIPFSLNGDKVKDTQINWEYSAMMFEDLTYLLGKP